MNTPKGTGSTSSKGRSLPVSRNRPNAALLATLMSAEAEELGTLRLSRTQRADFLSDMLHYFGYHLDAINKVQSLRILGEIF